MSDERTERMLRSVVRLGRLRGEDRDCQLTRGENGVLLCLYHWGDARPGQISKRIHLSSARVTIVLNALERREMILRVPDKQDRRRVNISLTDAGRRCVEQLCRRTAAEADQVLDYLGQEDGEALMTILERLVVFYEQKGGICHEVQSETEVQS